MAFGAALVWEVWRHFSHGWVAEYFVEPAVLFPYWPFTFVGAWPEPWMAYAHVAVVGLSALAVALGWRYRLSSIVLFVSFTWLFLMDQTRYLNHFYLIVLLSFIGIWLPANRELSLDVRSGRVARSTTVPAWSLLWVQFMVGVPYFFGGIAKIGPDWLLGFPMRHWLFKMDMPVIGPLLHTEAAVAFFSWGGLLFDLLIIPLLVWRRTRVLGLGLMLSFHLMNSRLFKIGIFPWMMILVTLVFLPPEWPRRVWDDIRNTRPAAVALGVGALLGAIIGHLLPVQESPVNSVVAAIGVGVFFWAVAARGWDAERPAHPEPTVPVGRAGFTAGMVFVAVQLLLPFRHLLIPGDVHWTEEGHRWSWHMKLRDKAVERFTYRVDPPGKNNAYEVNPREFLERHQHDKVAQHPEMTVLFGQWLAEREEPGTAVYVKGKIRLNQRPGQWMIDPQQDLMEIRVPWWPPAPWIVPLREELPPIRSVSVEPTGPRGVEGPAD